jgi:hypothetical protein
MNVDEIREMKSDFDSKLTDMVVEFENKTGLEISSIVIKREVSDTINEINVNARVIVA